MVLYCWRWLIWEMVGTWFNTYKIREKNAILSLRWRIDRVDEGGSNSAVAWDTGAVSRSSPHRSIRRVTQPGRQRWLHPTNTASSLQLTSTVRYVLLMNESKFNKNVVHGIGM